jgi:hypothetical protein
MISIIPAALVIGTYGHRWINFLIDHWSQIAESRSVLHRDTIYFALAATQEAEQLY